MKRIILSLGMIVFVGAVVAGATGAFFSDSETSVGNTLAAGAIDLGIDNHGYMNGNECVNIGTREDQEYVWQGNASYPEPGSPCSETWRVTYDLDVGGPHQFFNFTDLKPGDWGEDTISFHVNNNESWLCADVTLTSNDENEVVEPEADLLDTGPEGELADHIDFYWWADDGDNVFENDEHLLPAGPLGVLNVGQTATVALADANYNIWTGSENDPLNPEDVRFVGKAWCFGDTNMEPYLQDGGNNGNGPDQRPVICDGSNESNITQTDSLTADITFRAVQSRNNAEFLCRAS